jgi:glycosyltransferase involved in cell wall biosynthesis
MKILHVCETYLPTIGGAEQHIFEICKNAGKQNIDCHIITGTRDHTKNFNEKNITRWKIHERGIASFITFPFLVTKLSIYVKNFDIIQAHYSSCMAAATTIASRVFKRKVIVTLHGRGTLDSSVEGSVSARLWRFISLRLASTLVAPSNEIAEVARALVPNARILEIPNGVDTSIFRFRQDHIRNQDIVRIIILRRLTPKNGVSYAIESLIEIAKRNKHKSFKVDVIGDGSERESIEKMIVSEILDNLKIKLHGTKNHVDVLNILKDCDYSIFFSTAEAISLALLETMSLGIIPICTPVGGLVEVVKDSENGFLVENSIGGGLVSTYNAPRLLSDKVKSELVFTIQRAINESELKLNSISKKASLTASNFDWEKIFEITHQEYSYLLKF